MSDFSEQLIFKDKSINLFLNQKSLNKRSTAFFLTCIARDSKYRTMEFSLNKPNFLEFSSNLEQSLSRFNVNHYEDLVILSLSKQLPYLNTNSFTFKAVPSATTSVEILHSVLQNQTEIMKKEDEILFYLKNILVTCSSEQSETLLNPEALKTLSEQVKKALPSFSVTEANNSSIDRMVDIEGKPVFTFSGSPSCSSAKDHLACFSEGDLQFKRSIIVENSSSKAEEVDTLGIVEQECEIDNHCSEHLLVNTEESKSLSTTEKVPSSMDDSLLKSDFTSNCSKDCVLEGSTGEDKLFTCRKETKPKSPIDYSSLRINLNGLQPKVPELNSNSSKSVKESFDLQVHSPSSHNLSISSQQNTVPEDSQSPKEIYKTPKPITAKIPLNLNSISSEGKSARLNTSNTPIFPVTDRSEFKLPLEIQARAVEDYIENVCKDSQPHQFSFLTLDLFSKPSFYPSTSRLSQVFLTSQGDLLLIQAEGHKVFVYSIEDHKMIPVAEVEATSLKRVIVRLEVFEVEKVMSIVALLENGKFVVLQGKEAYKVEERKCFIGNRVDCLKVGLTQYCGELLTWSCFGRGNEYKVCFITKLKSTTFNCEGVRDIIPFQNSLFVLTESKVLKFSLEENKLISEMALNQSFITGKAVKDKLMLLSGEEVSIFSPKDGKMSSNEAKVGCLTLKKNEFLAKNEHSEFAFIVEFGEETKIKRYQDKAEHFRLGEAIFYCN